MSLFAIGDLHLHFQSEAKPNQLTDRLWRGHEEKLKKHCAKLIRPEDTLVLLGDHSWGKNLATSEADLEYVDNLPGRKILLQALLFPFICHAARLQIGELLLWQKIKKLNKSRIWNRTLPSGSPMSV